jgi:hypothetical protein
VCFKYSWTDIEGHLRPDTMYIHHNCRDEAKSFVLLTHAQCEEASRIRRGHHDLFSKDTVRKDYPYTIRIRAFVECRRLCRVLFIGHSAKPILPRAALGKVLRSVKILFTECTTLGTAKHSAKTALPRVKHSAKMALGKGPLAAVYSWRPSIFAECQILGTRQRTLCRVSSLDTRQSIFLFFYFVSQTFCGMFLHYVDLYVSFVDNYNRVFNR